LPFRGNTFTYFSFLVSRCSPATFESPPTLHAFHLPHFTSTFQASPLVPSVLGAPVPRSCAPYASRATCARNLVPVARGGAGCTCGAGRNERPLVGDWVGGIQVEGTAARPGQQVFDNCALALRTERFHAGPGTGWPGLCFGGAGVGGWDGGILGVAERQSVMIYF
jgi:hypothetical protein